MSDRVRVGVGQLDASINKKDWGGLSPLPAGGGGVYVIPHGDPTYVHSDVVWVPRGLRESSIKSFTSWSVSLSILMRHCVSCFRHFALYPFTKMDTLISLDGIPCGEQKAGTHGRLQQ